MLNYQLQRLTLHHFRNYVHQEFNFDHQHYIIYGRNGAGKTNLLEAISMFNDGKGLRRANLQELRSHCSQNTNHSYSTYNHLTSPTTELIADIKINNIPHELKYQFASDYNNYHKKTLLVNNKIITKKHASYHYLKCIWMIPQMDNFFLQEQQIKRNFIDTLINNLDIMHQERLKNYNKLLKERNKLLKYTIQDTKWLNQIEEQLAIANLPILIARIDFIDKLNTILKNSDLYPVSLTLTGDIETLFQANPAISTMENKLKEQLANNRPKDQLLASTSIGIHKTKLHALNLINNLNADNSSTGEQKLMLINIILSFLELIHQEHQIAPLLLLDEVNIHLDNTNTQLILKKLMQFNSQLFITSPQKIPLNGYYDQFQCIDLH